MPVGIGWNGEMGCWDQHGGSYLVRNLNKLPAVRKHMKILY